MKKNLALHLKLQVIGGSPLKQVMPTLTSRKEKRTAGNMLKQALF